MSNSDGIPILPYFKGEITQNMDPSANTSKLDLFTGRGDYHKSKKEIAPLFENSKNMSFVNGTPNFNNQLMDRYIQSDKQPMVKPFDQIKVGPGIDDGFSSKPSGSFHDYKIQELARPKNIDELRSKNNPQISYKGRVKSGKKIDKRTTNPNLKKYRPDKFYLNSKDRYFKTTGAYLKQKQQQNFILIDRGKKNSKEFLGSAAPVTHIRPQKISLAQKSKRSVYKNSGLRNIKLEDKNTKLNSKQGYFAKPNERDLTQENTYLSNLITNVKAIITPIQDEIKITKKENTIGNNRPEGNFNATVPKKLTVYDPNDIARTTIKETTIISEHDGNLSGPNKLTIHDPNDIAKPTIKETTENCDHDSNLSGPNKLTTYDPNDIAKTTIKETTIDSEHDGNISGPNKLTTYDPNDIAKTTIKETLIHNDYIGQYNQTVKKNKVYKTDTKPKITIRNTLNNIDFNANVTPSNNTANKHKKYIMDKAKNTIKQTTIDNTHISNIRYIKDNGYLTNEYNAPATSKQYMSDNEYSGNPKTHNEGYGYITNKKFAPATNKHDLSNNQYIGSMNSSDKKHIDYNSMYNAQLNSNKEQISRGRKPTQNNVKICN